MLAIAGHSGGAAASGILKYQDLRRRLGGHRLPYYHCIQEMLCDFSLFPEILGLWRELFPEKTLPEGDVWDIELKLIETIDAEMFPISMSEYETFYSAGEHVVGGPVGYAGGGIPWEVEYIEGMEDPLRPLAAIVARGLVPEAEWADALTNFGEAAAEWLETHSRWAPLDETTAACHELVRGKLAELAAPLDGLAVAYDCLLRQTGNPFFDAPEFYRYDYESIYSFYEWSAADLRTLQAFYEAARPGLDKLDAYGEWWNATGGGARDHVLEILAQAFELEGVREWEEDNDD